MIRVEIASFSGPMDLLLALLRQSKLDIYDIEISSITEQYLEVIQTADIPPDELSDFIRMASILVQMKVRMLLREQNEEDETVSKEEFIRRLSEYRVFKELAHRLRPLEEEGAKIYAKMGEDPERYRKTVFEVLEGEPEDLFAVLQRWQERKLRKKVSFHPEAVIQREEFPEDAVARRIREKMACGKHFTFLDLFDANRKKENIIMTFLLMLELSNRNAVTVHQPAEKEIQIEIRDRERCDQVLRIMSGTALPEAKESEEA